jgi:hypothetical protein
LVPLIFGAIGAGIVLVSLLKIVRFSGSMLERPLARIAGERTRVSGGGNDQAARTSYYVTLESPDGFRTELEATAKVAGAVSEGDFGVAYVRDRYLLDFARLRV